MNYSELYYSSFYMLAICKTIEIATYLRRLFTAELESKGEDVPLPDWPIDLLEECHYSIKVMIAAVQNQS